MAESFFQRWSRRKAEQTGGDRPGDDHAPAQTNPSPASASGASAGGLREEALPSLDDVARLTRDSDYSMFVSKGVDANVRRAAMKKLFADPHFNVMDGLDIYIDDYTKPSPLTPAMLAALQHTQPMFEAVANEERKREERERAKQHAVESTMESEQVPSNALADEAQNGDAEQHSGEPAPDPTQTDFSGAEPLNDERRVLPNTEDDSGSSIRHSE